MGDFKLIDGELLLQEMPDIKEKWHFEGVEKFNGYLAIYSVYHYLLMQYLTKEFYLKDADEEMIKHKEMFSSVKEEEMDFYQKCCSSFLKYFYLRNNIHIERLSQEDVDYLYDIYKSDDKALNEERKHFIERTYPKVIFDNPHEDRINTNYGPDNGKFFAPANAMIIGVRYAQFENLDRNNALDDFAKKEFLVAALMSLLERRIAKKGGVRVKVIKYDDYSVKSKRAI